MASRGKDASGVAPLFKVDDDVRRGVSALNTAGQTGCRQVLEILVVEASQGSNAPSSSSSASASAIVAAQAAAVATCGGSEAAYAIIHHFMSRILRHCVRTIYSTTDSSTMTSSLAEIVAALVANGIGETIAKDIAATVKSKATELARSYLDAAPQPPSVTNVRWRVDVVISSSLVNRVMRPTILLELQLSDGHVTTMEMPVEKFHELRYASAKVLAEMGVVADHPVLRIA